MTDTWLDLAGKLPEETVAAIGLIAQTAARLKIPILVVGATARDIILEYRYGLKPKRATSDVDFGMMLESWDEYERFKQALLDTGEVTYDRENLNFRRITDGLLIDVVPFGKIESPPGQIAFPPDKNPKLTTAGFAECYDAAIEVRLDQETVVRAVSLAGLVVLKIIAWNDRPIDRERDVQDLWFVLNNYLKAGNQDRLFDEHADLLDADFDYELAGARVLGRDVRTIIGDSTAEILLKTLADETEGRGISRMANIINRSEQRLEDMTEAAVRMLESFKLGLMNDFEG